MKDTKVKKQNHNKEEKDVQTVKALKGKTSKKVKKHKASSWDGNFEDARKMYKPVKNVEGASETSEKILSLARKAGLTCKLHNGKIRCYDKQNNPILQVRGASRETPSVFIHIHARSDEETKQFFAKVGLAKDGAKVWKQPEGWTPYRYVSKHTDKLLPRLKRAIPVCLKRATL